MASKASARFSMINRICLALLFFSATMLVAGAPPFRRDLPRRRGCGTHISAERRASAEGYFKTHRLPASHGRNSSAVLDVHFHVVYANETLAGGYVPDEAIQRQLDVMNRDYQTTGVSFKLVNTSRIENEGWFSRVAPESPEEKEMKEAHRYGTAAALNVWTVGFLEGDGQGLLGYATFPSDYSTAPTLDGVVLLFSTMPIVSSTPTSNQSPSPSASSESTMTTRETLSITTSSSSDSTSLLSGLTTTLANAISNLKARGPDDDAATAAMISKPPYNQGRTLTHEAGHWAGLYHTFEGGCVGNGDFVDDTPPTKEASYGCPAPKSSCPGGKQVLTKNFMDYTDDACMTGFTEGQAVRIRAQLRTYRGVDI